MKIDFAQLMTGMDGGFFLDNDKPVTLWQLAVKALLANFSDENPPGEEKYQRYELASKLTAVKGPADATPADIARIKHCSGKLYPVTLVGPVYRALDGKANPALPVATKAEEPTLPVVAAAQPPKAAKPKKKRQVAKEAPQTGNA